MDPETKAKLLNYVTLLTTIAVLIVTYFKWSYLYWKRRNLPYLEPTIPYGNSENPIRRKRTMAKRMLDYYNEFKAQGHKHGGIYVTVKPIYFPVDPEYIKNVLAKDFHHFMDRGLYSNEKADPLSAHLLNLTGQRWKNLRAKITPTFTSGKMKMMFPTLIKCADPMIDHLNKLSSEKDPANIKEVLQAFTTDIIGSCVFGIECNSFTDPNSEFLKYGRKIFKPDRSQAAKGFFIFCFPKVAKFFNFVMTSKDVSAFYKKVIRETADYREKNNVRRDDFMQILLDLKNKEGIDRLTLDEITAQAFVFFLAGYETSSTTMTFCLLELARNMDVQEKLREEISDVFEKTDGKWCYESIMEMKYLNQVVEETLRKYPPAVMLGRICIKDYPVPDTDVTIEKGTRVFIPAYALHHDADYYPEPEKFVPERFSEDNKRNRHPFSYLPFGEGPRNCIGIRFGLLETKVGLSLLLKHFRFTLNEQTKYPIDFDLASFLLSPKNPIYLDVEKIF